MSQYINDSNAHWSRRKFIGAAVTSGTAILLKPIHKWTSEEHDVKINRIVNQTLAIDTHNHVDLPFNLTEFENQQYDLKTELLSSGFAAICMTFCVDRPMLDKEGEAFDRFILTLDEMDTMLKANNLTRALHYADLKMAWKAKKPIVIQSIEGGHFIENNVERIQLSYNRGVRHLGLMHDGQTNPPMGDIYTEKPQFGGLTKLGKDTIEECNRLGILVDLTHCSNDAMLQALEVSSKPMIISHTGLNTQLGTNEKMATMMMPRLISKEHAKLFANAGGIIGVWTHLADSPIDYAKNIRALVDVVGTEHVCLGTDTKMILPNNKNQHEKTTNKNWGCENKGFFYSVVDALLKTGFTEKEIIQIGGDNYCQIFDKATRV
jgi:membrane dipeptidase